MISPKSTCLPTRCFVTASRSTVSLAVAWPCRKKNFVVKYQRVREGHVKAFSRTYQPGSTEWVPYETLAAEPSVSCSCPTWLLFGVRCSAMPKLNRYADVGKGLEHMSADDQDGHLTRLRNRKMKSKRTTLWFQDSQVGTRKQLTHRLPKICFLNLDPGSQLRLRFRRDQPGASSSSQLRARQPRAVEAEMLLDPPGHPVTTISRLFVRRSLACLLPSIGLF